MTASFLSPPPGLSLARLAAFEQCPRRLWLAVHRPDLGRADGDGGASFDAARRLRELAQAQSAKAYASGERAPLFDVSFAHEGVFVRVDILEPDGADGWHLVLVKGGAGPKDGHVRDLATQLWIARSSGLGVTRASVRHVERGFVLPRDGEPSGLLCDAEFTQALEPIVSERPSLVARARGVVAGPEPMCATGPHCLKPTPCEFRAHCAAHEAPGPEWPVSILPNGGWKKWARQGVEDLLDLDETTMAKPREARIVAATRSGTPFHDAVGARTAMADWAFPRAWLDFETISGALPLWAGTRPYQTIPFQFSLHLEQEDGTLTHHEYLRCDGGDPRPDCAAALARLIPEGASVIAYNAGFERAVLRALAEQVPEHAERLYAQAEATVDLLPIARNHWYHRDQRGSWSIKAVLPTIAPELDYAGLEVKDGGMAQESFLEAIDPATSPERRWAIEEALRAYCARDTYAMIVLARRLVAGA
ncbi:DUF2779 domain-containing protein [Novosphingobium profundi]|uniref:DUF2779 domain-containing protein n=1 Tax=Novosphingobium profundi TaxID=1774954 RepID=UPI001BDB5463|nr:DUF2779 domain-containing protein [Novosphingobium profundi]MBT0671731.1 DUF2779 domain-containing protein [Novosphingobium profundi]